MTRTRSQTDGPVPGEPMGEGAAGVRRAAVGQGVSSTSAARTRTLGGETVEFKAVDYQPPQTAVSTADRRPQAVDPAAGARLGRAEGVSSLRDGRPSSRAAERSQELSGRTKALMAVVVALVAVAVFAGGYFFMRGVLADMNENAAAATSVNYATDAYTLVAVVGPSGELDTVYLGYVDSINERSEFVELPANTYYSEDGSHLNGLDEVYAARGLEGLALAVGSLSDVEVVTAFAVDAAQLEEVFALVEPADGSADVRSLAASVWNADQLIAEPALRGLLLTMQQIGPDAHVLLSAPVDEQELGGKTVEVLRHQDWITLVRGMRDPSSGL